MRVHHPAARSSERPAGHLPGSVVGVASFAAATVLRLALTPVLGDTLPWTTYYAGVVVAAGLGGVTGGVVAALLSAVTGHWLFLPARFAASDTMAVRLAPAALFLGASSAIIAVAARMRTAQLRAEASAGLLRCLDRIREGATGTDTVDALLQRTVDALRDELGVTTAVVLLRSYEDGEVLRVRAAAGVDEDVRRRVRVPIGEGFSGRVAATRRTVVWQDVDHSRLTNRYFADKGIRSLLGVPLVAGDDLVGVLHVGRMAPNAFVADDVRLVELAAGPLGFAIARQQAVDARLAAEGELETALRDLRTIFDAAPACVWFTHDPTGRVVEGNRTANALFGVGAGDLAGPVRDGDHAGHRRRFRSNGVDVSPEELPLSKAIATKRAVSDQELEVDLGDGRRVVFAVSAQPLLAPDGTVRGGVCTAVDVTERERNEADLRAREEFTRRVTDVAPCILYVYDHAEKRNAWGNREMVTTLGFAPEELSRMSGRLLETLVHPDDRARYESHRERLLQLGDGEVAELAYRMRCADGSWRWLESRDMVFRRDTDGRVRQIVGAALDVTDRVQAQERLRESEARFRNMADTAPAMLWITDERDVCTFRSRGWYEFTGQPDDHPLDAGWAEAVHPDDLAEARRTFLDATRRRVPFELDYRLRRADGTYRWVVAAGRPRFERDGRFVGCIGSIIDVHERKTMEQRAHEQRAQLEAVYGAMRDGLVVVDAAGGVVLVNDAEATLCGYASPEEMRSHLVDLTRVYELSELGGDPLPLERWPVPRALAGESFGNVELRACRRDTGDERVIAFSGEPVRDGDGRVVMAVVISRDVTEKSRAEAALRESESFYRQTLESIPGMSFTTTPDGACDYVSEQWVTYTGIPAREQLGAGWQEVLHPDDRERVFASWRAAVEGRATYDLEYRVRRRHGGYGWFKVRGRPIRDAAGDIVRWLGTAVNIDDLKQAEAALRENDRRKDEFLAMLAHELRNPLAPIRNAVEVLAQVGSREPQLERSRAIIARQVAHMARLVDDLLDVSRITRGKIVLHEERVALAEVVDVAVEAARPVIEQHEQTLSVHPPVGAYVEGDRARLVQILTNLLTNAAKFSPSGGHITLWTRVAAREVVVSVRDTGAGIPKDAQERIFDLFAQEDTSLDRARGGLGIGLTLVKRLVELHRGTVRVTSEGPGTGAEFSVTLPLVSEVADAPQDDRERAVRGSGQLRILVVEDNADSAESFRMLLELDGHEVHVATDGRSGLREIDRRRHDVAFIDLGLPELDGLTVARRVREQHPKWPVLVAVSGYGREEDKRRAREAGFDEHMTKPVDFAALRAFLASVGGAVVVESRSRLLH